MQETELIYENTMLHAENDKLKKRIRELEHLHQLDQSAVVNLRRQIELLTEKREADND